MGYQPKFSQERHKFSDDLIRTAPEEKPKKQPVKKKKEKKHGVLYYIIFVLLGILVIPAAAKMTQDMLTDMLPNLGRPAGQTVYEKTAGMAIMDRFDTIITNQKSDALDGVFSVKKRYWLSDDTKVAPEPDQSKFGEGQPEELGWLLEKAADLLEGQTMYFSTETKLMPGTVAKYYFDDSILAITWKEVHDGGVYTMSEVKVSHPSQFRRHLAGGEYGSEMQFLTTEMAESVNAVVASSGDFYRFRDFGTSVYEGVARRVEGTYASTCYIDKNGDMHFTYGGEILTMEDAQKYVDENDITFSLAFGPVLVDNGERCEPNWYGVGEINDEYARAAICQMDKLHYLMVAANREGNYPQPPDIHTFAKNIAATGCKMAYSLDGGQTAAIVMNDQLINRVVYGYQRKISDIIYFATAVPDGG